MDQLQVEEMDQLQVVSILLELNSVPTTTIKILELWKNDIVANEKKLLNLSDKFLALLFIRVLGLLYGIIFGLVIHTPPSPIALNRLGNVGVKACR